MQQCQCRLAGCNRSFKSTAWRGIHEAAHIKRGEAIRGGDGGLIATGQAEINVRMGANGRAMSPSKGTCEVCGISATKFKHDLAFQGHRSYHVRRKEANWANPKQRGGAGTLVKTPLGERTFPQTAIALSEPAPAAVEPGPTPEQILYDEMSTTHAAAQDLQKAAALIQFASLMNRVGPDTAMQMVLGMKNMRGVGSR
jgi:hypothetical protein